MAKDVSAAIPPVIHSKIQEYVKIRTQREELEPSFKDLERREDQLAAELCQLIDDAGLKSVPTKEFGTFQARFLGPYVNVKKIPGTKEADEEALQGLIEWSKQQTDEGGHALFDVLFGWNLKIQRLSSEFKRRAEEGEELPTDYVDFYNINSITWSQRPGHLKQAKGA